MQSSVYNKEEKNKSAMPKAEVVSRPSVLEDVVDLSRIPHENYKKKENSLMSDQTVDNSNSTKDSNNKKEKKQEEKKAEKKRSEEARPPNNPPEQPVYRQVRMAGQPPGPGGRPPMQPASSPLSFPKKSPISLQTIASITMILLMGTSLVFLVKNQMEASASKSDKGDSYYKSNFETLAAQYKRVTPKQCKQSMYYGLNREFNAYINIIMSYMAKGKDSSDDEDSSEITSGGTLRGSMLQKNLIVYGMPGTGKSFFARKIFLQAALNIRAEQLKKQYKTKYLNIIGGKGSQQVIKELYDCDGTIELYQIDSAMFLNKLVGETEQTLRGFMNFIEWRQKIVPVIVFIDEAEALFAARKGSDGGGGVQVSNNMKNMWLTWLDGLDTDDSKRIFVIAATNFFESIDQALVRRFKSQLGIPTYIYDARVELLEKELFAPKIVHVESEEKKIAIATKTSKIHGNNMMQIVEELTKLRYETKKPVPFRKLEKEVAAANKRAEASEKEQKAQTEFKMSNPEEVITTLVWGKADTISITKESMMKIEEELAPKTDEDLEEQEIGDKILENAGIKKNRFDYKQEQDVEIENKHIVESVDTESNAGFFGNRFGNIFGNLWGANRNEGDEDSG
ncbi:uncharacterized protein NESG_00235 [Nematocida ausubeli]|uniref:AAA+ ATPase domain-containing protein n=1 Tax=Nematocida ausubeli (strain ATCC PRA-371 / ERTm2) TaxID=1913371 RepID=A0A086J4U1_NEMA1|nr:uncharacterized protein NESG_00235 [Nematocida ausubeli]KFG27159.1 hypothetical protein NESG_00235 [Nematocida ausubeli]